MSSQRSMPKDMPKLSATATPLFPVSVITAAISRIELIVEDRTDS